MSPVSSPAALSCALVRGAGRIERELARDDPRRLLAVVYGIGDLPLAEPPMPTLAVPNRALGEEPVAEIWRSQGPVRVARRTALAWGEDELRLGGCLTLSVADGVDLAAATRAQFDTLLDLLTERGYPHLLRVWNYLPGINRGAGDLERYRLFNLGRARAFEARLGAEGEDWTAPASSAVGTPGDELRTIFLASRAPVLHLENPRQVPAYRYPSQYGPRAPTFSRASLAVEGVGLGFFLSGTASVVGHETLHVDSLERQVEETLRNVERTVEQARRRTAREVPGLDGFDLVKVYVRDPGRLADVRARLGLAPEAPVIVLEADICRSDLLVEIEGVALR